MGNYFFEKSFCRNQGGVIGSTNEPSLYTRVTDHTTGGVTAELELLAPVLCVPSFDDS